jgi:hypothetical protein
MGFFFFDYRNPFAQVEVVGSEGWLALPGTGFRREPYTKLLIHAGGEIYVDNREPKVEMFLEAMHSSLRLNAPVAVAVPA